MISSHQNVSAKFSVLRRVILYGILFFTLSVVQCSFLSRLSFLSVVPNIVLGGVCAVSLLDDQKTATVCGIGAGFLLDAIGGAGISLSPLLFMIVAIICSEIAKKMLAHFLSWLLLLFVASLAGAAVTFVNLLAAVGGVSLLALFFPVLLPEIVFTYIFSLPIYFIALLCVRFADSKNKFKI